MTRGWDERVAIVGIGQTRYGKRGEFAEVGTLSLACQAIAGACADAGVNPADIDGFSGYADEAVQPVSIAGAFGSKRVRFVSMVWGGGGGGVLGALANAAMAITSRTADIVVVHRALSMFGDGGRFGQQQVQSAVSGQIDPLASFSGAFGLLTPAQVFALHARRHMHRFGTTTDHFAEVAVNARLMAARNPAARFRDPITVEEHHNSRMIADPLRMLDCCMESDGAAAVVLTSAERARDLRDQPVYVGATAVGITSGHGSRTALSDDVYASSGQQSVADQLFARAGVDRADFDVALIYDHFTPLVLMALEDFGFCPKGESGPFVADGNIRLGGSLPLNTHGGHLAEAYLHGMNHIIEAVRQLRGSATNQVAGAEVAFLGGAGGVTPSSACVLTR